VATPRSHLPCSIQVVRETHEAPAEVQERITQAGGLSRFDEPCFRVVWGASRLSWVGGLWTDYDTQGNRIGEIVELRQVPKYLPTNRWHIERWMPPEAYGSPEQWYRLTTEVHGGRSIAALGPFPSRGEYEHCFTLERHGEFIPLNAAVCDWVVRAIGWARAQPPSASRLALVEREMRQARRWDCAADDLLSEAVPALGGQPFVTCV
jgi:hypothetical protein